MPISHAIILGLIQGVTEAFPISSSAHLVIIPWIFHWRYQGVAFDVALHLGTALAFGIYFFKDWVDIFYSFVTGRGRSPRNLLGLLILGTIPAGLAGIIFEKKADALFRSPLLIAAMLVLFALVLWIADRTGRKEKRMEAMDTSSALTIGCAQILALIPGVSRSGITMTAGLFTGFSREAAARFSFLLASPVVIAAGVLKLHKLTAHDLTAAFWAGIAASALSGLLSIHLFLKFVRRASLDLFVLYRIVFALIILFLLFVR
jgi:undecaprenyl-diphosphatase